MFKFCMPSIDTREHRLKSVFPPGFDGSSSGSLGKSVYYAHSSEQLYVTLIDNYNPMTRAERIVVKAAWYGKQTGSAEHEFILVEVEDRRDQGKDEKGLINYLVLDRNVLNKPAKSTRLFRHSRVSVQGGKAVDTFRVSYDGDLKRLLNDCNLCPHRFLEHLQFRSDCPLHLYELVTLADVVSSQYPNYQAIGSNCFLFAGLVWDSLCQLYPTASRNKPMAKERGKYGWLRYTPQNSQMKEVCNKASEKILQAKLKIDRHNELLEEMVCIRLAELTKATEAPIKESDTRD